MPRKYRNSLRRLNSRLVDAQDVRLKTSSTMYRICSDREFKFFAHEIRSAPAVTRGADAITRGRANPGENTERAREYCRTRKVNYRVKPSRR